MNFFKSTELFTTQTEEVSQEVTSTSEAKTSEMTTTEQTTEKTTVLIPIEEAKKDIILLASLGTIIFGLFLMCIVCICRRRKSKISENLELFESLAASSSTTVFDKNQ